MKSKEQYLMEFGAKVKQRRTELNMSQDDLAKRVGYKGKAAVSCIERGQREPGQDTIRMLSKALDIPASYLMGWTDIDGKSTLEETSIEDKIRSSPTDRLLKYMHIITDELSKRGGK